MAANPVHSIPYRHMQRAVRNAATGFVQAGLRVDLDHEARLVAEAERWECAVQAEVDEPWWEKWDVPGQRSFLDDMRDLEEQYDRYPPHMGVPEHMPDLAEPRLVCWTTLQRMREVFSRIQIVQQVVHEIARSPPPGTVARLWAQNTGDWFQLGFLDLIKPADFHLADVKLRRRVVDEFERVDKHLLELYKEGRSASLPALSDMSWFEALVVLLEQDRVHLGVRNSFGLDLKQQSSIIANKLLGLPWWRKHPEGTQLQKLILGVFKRLEKSPYLMTDAAKFGDVMKLLDQLRDEDDEPSLTPSRRRCSVQSLGHGRFGHRT